MEKEEGIMRKLFGFTFLVFTIAVATAVSPLQAATTNVTITKAGFVPANVTVKQGDTVTWTNSDTVVHQVTFKNYACNLVIQPGQQGSCTFTQTGKFNYSDPSQKGKFNGSVTVQAGPLAVSLSPSKRIVTYRSPVALTGRISSGQQSQNVTLFGQQCGSATPTQLGVVQTAAGGGYSFTTTPLMNTTYQARWKTASSSGELVKVRPRVVLKKLARHKYRVRVSAARSFAGKYGLFQRYKSATATWVTVKRVTLGSSTLGVAPTVVSAKVFKASVRARLRVRVLVPQSQVGSCYAFGVSNKISS
jgi:plastocyanin